MTAVVPTYNRGDHVIRAVKSILGQTRPIEEVIVVDDGSTDGTPERLRDRFGDAVRVIVQENAGPCAARRRGLLAATSDWIAYLDSDDEWYPTKTAVQLEAARWGGDAVVTVFGDLDIVFDRQVASVFESYWRKGAAEDFVLVDDPIRALYPVMVPYLQTCLFRRATMLEVDAFSEGLRASDDYYAIGRMLLAGRSVATNRRVARLYRTSELTGSSFAQTSTMTPDHYRARQLLFGEFATVTDDSVWRARQAENVRAQCRSLARLRETGFRRVAFQQFSAGANLKALVFTAAALAGRPGLSIWERLMEVRRPPFQEGGSLGDPLGVFRCRGQDQGAGDT